MGLPKGIITRTNGPPLYEAMVDYMRPRVIAKTKALVLPQLALDTLLSPPKNGHSFLSFLLSF